MSPRSPTKILRARLSSQGLPGRVRPARSIQRTALAIPPEISRTLVKLGAYRRGDALASLASLNLQPYHGAPRTLPHSSQPSQAQVGLPESSQHSINVDFAMNLSPLVRSRPCRPGCPEPD